MAPLLLAFTVALTGCGAERVDNVGPGPQSLSACLADHGWRTTIEEDGAVVFDGPKSEVPAYQADVDECSADSVQKLDSNEIRRLYKEAVEAAACLRDKGQDIPTEPTLDEYIKAYDSGKPWAAHQFIDAPDEQTWLRFEQLCPQPSL